MTVGGVTPPEFLGTAGIPIPPTDLWMPVETWGVSALKRRDWREGGALARLRPGVSCPRRPPKWTAIAAGWRRSGRTRTDTWRAILRAAHRHVVLCGRERVDAEALSGWRGVIRAVAGGGIRHIATRRTAVAGGHENAIPRRQPAATGCYKTSCRCPLRLRRGHSSGSSPSRVVLHDVLGRERDAVGRVGARGSHEFNGGAFGHGARPFHVQNRLRLVPGNIAGVLAVDDERRLFTGSPNWARKPATSLMAISLSPTMAMLCPVPS